jgi:hypothetical protein
MKYMLDRIIKKKVKSFKLVGVFFKKLVTIVIIIIRRYYNIKLYFYIITPHVKVKNTYRIDK